MKIRQAIALLTLAMGLASACAVYQNDRCFVSNEKYYEAKQFFMETGSLDLTMRRLKDLQWTRPEINETVYRLEKEFEVFPEELPPSVQ